MSKSAYVRARIEPGLKMQAEAIFNELGVTATQVITMLYKQVSRKHEIPLDLSLPNKETAKAIEEARKGEGIVRCKDVDDMFDKLGI
jgi:DNA-damage-inducible protein J